jgi:hypothetical protein
VEFDEKASFDGNQSDFFAYYLATSEGLHAVLPDAPLSPGEFTGGGTCTAQKEDKCVYDTRDFVQFAAAHHLKYSDIPRSLNDFLNHGDAMPSVAVKRAVDSYARLPSGTVAEIHQFGLMFEPFGRQDGSDPSPIRANFEFQALMGLWENLHPRRVFHWEAFVPVGEMKFLSGIGYVRLVLDHYLGYHAYRLNPKDATSGGPPTELMAINFRNPTGSAVVLSSFCPSMATGKRTIRVEMPSTVHGRALRTIRYRASDNVFLAIREDLTKENNLKPEFAACPSCLGFPVQMGANVEAARLMLRKNWPKYQQIMRRDLKWNPSDGAASLSGNDLVVTLEYNELMVVETQ